MYLRQHIDHLLGRYGNGRFPCIRNDDFEIRSDTSPFVLFHLGGLYDELIANPIIHRMNDIMPDDEPGPSSQEDRRWGIEFMISMTGTYISHGRGIIEGVAGHLWLGHATFPGHAVTLRLVDSVLWMSLEDVRMLVADCLEDTYLDLVPPPVQPLHIRRAQWERKYDLNLAIYLTDHVENGILRRRNGRLRNHRLGQAGPSRVAFGQSQIQIPTDYFPFTATEIRDLMCFSSH